MIEMADHFDFNDYPKDHEIRKALGNERVLVNKKIPGKFKDELSGTIMKEFIGLRPKMYSVLRAGENPNTANPKPEGFKESIRKAKGVPMDVVKGEFHHQRYRSVLFEKKLDDTIDFTTIRSEKHRLYTIQTSKIGLSPFDSKKWILPNGLDTMAHGDCRIPI